MSNNYWNEVFDGNPGYYGDIDNPTRTVIAKYITNEKDTVLDLGCGIGAFRSLIPNNPYTGFDYAEKAIEIAKRYEDAKTHFEVFDARNLDQLADNSFDIIVMRHFLENQKDWREVVKQCFRVANKKVIMVIRRPFVSYPSHLVEEDINDTWVWDINRDEFNMLARTLSVNVSYGTVETEEMVIIGKHLDDVVVTLDDFYNENHNLHLLDDLKRRFPKFKATLFCIPSKCTINFLEAVKEGYPWLQLAVHGWFHDTQGLIAQESNFWTYAEANKYLKMAEDMGVFEKIFRAPGWNMNIETYQALADRGYIIADHLGHDRYEHIKLPRYTTGHIMEVHGHIQNVNMNGLEELASTKCNFGENTEFHFVSEAPLDLETNYLPNRYQ